MNSVIVKKTELKWYIAYTYPNYEKKVERLLIQNKINCFLPLQKVERQWSDRIKKIDVPLFPGYIFINSTSHEKYDALNITGVLKFISFGGQPATLSDKDMETIKQISLSNISITKEHSFDKGDYVKILEGPFVGLTGYLFERKGKSRFGFRLDAIDESISIEICASMIEKINPPVFN